MENNFNLKTEIDKEALCFQIELSKLELDDFLGLAQIAKVNIFTEENKIRNDFGNIEKEIISFYKTLNKTEKNKFLRRVRQITKYNKIHGQEG